MRRFLAQLLLQRRGVRKRDTVFSDKSSETSPIAFVAQRTGEQRELKVAAGFIPRAESARHHILAHALFRAPEKCELPIVNRPRAVRGQVRDPAAFHEFNDDAVRAVFHEMRAIHENDAGVTLSRGANAIGTLRFGGTLWR